MQQEKLILKNKLDTLFINSPGSTFSCVQIWFRAGSALENKSDYGIAHFLEHMFFKGSKTTSGKQIAKRIEAVGGELNAFTSFDYTCYYANIPNSELKTGVKTILDMVANPAFQEKYIPTERNVVVEELKKSIDNPSQYAFYEIQKKLFSSGYNHPILGNYKTITNFTRKQLIEFRKKYYNLANAMLIIAGDLTNKDKLIKEIEKYKIPSGRSSTLPKFTLKKNAKITAHNKDVKMSSLHIIFQGSEFTDDVSVAEDLAFTSLGHGETSRLYSNLVLETSIANSCTSSTMFFSRGSMHSIRISFPPQNLTKVLSKLKMVIRDVHKNGFSRKEINKIKNQYASSRIFEKESLESYAFSLGHSFAQTGSIDSEQEFLEKVKKVSPEAVNNTINNIFARDLLIQLQTPEGIDNNAALKKIEDFKIKHHNKYKRANLKIKKITDNFSKYDPQLKCVEIKKGIDLLYRQNMMTPTYVLHAYLRGGLVDETRQTNGLYNLLSSNLTKGYNGIAYANIKHILENSSTTLQSFSGKNAYGLTLHGLTENFKDSLNIFSGSLLSPDMPKEYLNHEKEMILRVLENQVKDPTRQCFNLVGEHVFNTHPYAFSNLGSESNIKKFSKKILMARHLKQLKNEKVLFTYCGNLELDIVKDKLAEQLDGLESRYGSKYKAISYTPKQCHNYHMPFNREQTQIFIGLPTKGIAAAGNIYLSIITTILSGQGSILFEEIREKHGLSYVIQPVHFSALDGGYWGIYMACGNENVKKSISTLNSILDDLAQKGISELAFNTAKKMIKGQSLLNIQTNEDYANIYSVPYFFGLGVDHFHLKNIKIEKLAYANFQKRLKTFLKAQRYTITVGSN